MEKNLFGSKKFFDQQNWVKRIPVQKFVCGKHFRGVTKFCWVKKMGKTNFYLKKFWVKNITWARKFGSKQYFFWSKILLDQNISWVRVFRSKHFLCRKKFWEKKTFGPKNFGSK